MAEIDTQDISHKMYAGQKADSRAYPIDPTGQIISNNYIEVDGRLQDFPSNRVHGQGLDHILRPLLTNLQEKEIVVLLSETSSVKGGFSIPSGSIWANYTLLSQGQYRTVVEPIADEIEAIRSQQTNWNLEIKEETQQGGAQEGDVALEDFGF